MSITITTLAAAVLATDGTVNLVSTTNVTGPGPNKTTRVCIWVGREQMEVIGSPVSGICPVVRGTNGTLREAHPIGDQVWVGTESDFAGFADAGLGPYSSFTRAFETTNPTTAIGSATLTEAQVLGGLITGTPVGAANYTMPTATALIAAMGAFTETPFIGQSFYFTILNTSAGANTITLVAGTGVTLAAGATATVAQNNGKRFRVVITGIVTPAYTVYSEGTFVF